MNKCINLLSIDEPNSIYVEMYRSIRTNIEYSSVDKKMKILNVTSTIASEGKTTTTCNLAVLSANKNKKVLIIDLDLRKPSVHKFFNIKNKNGLTDLLIDFSNNGNNVNLNNYLQKIEHENIINELYVITAGTETINPFEILNSERIKILIEFLRDKFDEIILDSPPSGILADGIITSKLADGTIYVIESKKTKIDLIQKTISQLKKMNINILGVILTKVPVKLKTYSYYYGNYYRDDSLNASN